MVAYSQSPVAGGDANRAAASGSAAFVAGPGASCCATGGGPTGGGPRGGGNGGAGRGGAAPLGETGERGAATGEAGAASILRPPLCRSRRGGSVWR